MIQTRETNLDQNATKPMWPEAVQEFVRTASSFRVNPSSSHALGARARDLLEDCRARIAEVIGAEWSR